MNAAYNNKVRRDAELTAESFYEALRRAQADGGVPPTVIYQTVRFFGVVRVVLWLGFGLGDGDVLGDGDALGDGYAFSLNDGLALAA